MVGEEAGMITTAEAAEAPVRRRVTRLASNLNFRNVGAVYVWIALIVIFTIWKPSLFFTARTAKTTLNEYAITGLAATGGVITSAGLVLAGTFARWLAFTGQLLPVR